MIQWLVQWFRNLTMKSQIILINFFILLLALLLVGISHYVQTQIIIKTFQNSSSIILSYSDHTKISNTASHLSVLLENKFMAVIRSMEQISNFHLFYESFQSRIKIAMPLESCIPLEQFSMNLTFLRVPRFCYQAQGVADFITLPQNDERVMEMHYFISLLNHFSLLLNLNFTGMVQIVSVSATKYYAMFPFDFLFPTFDITTIPWYINHLNQSVHHPDQLLVISPLTNFIGTNDPVMDISYSLMNTKTKNIEGVIREALLLTEYLIPKIPYNMMLISNEGRVVYNRLEYMISQNLTFYIYNESITGFNFTDWQSIQQFSDNVEHDNMLELENKLQNQLIHLYAMQIMKQNFTLIVYSNITSIVEIEAQSNIIHDLLVLQLTYTFLALIILWIVSIQGQNLILWIIFRPMTTLTYIVKNHVLSLGNNANKEVFKMIHSRVDDNVLSLLKNKLLHLSDIINQSQRKKSTICKRWESLKYNRLEENLGYEVIKDVLWNLPNNYQTDVYAVQLILNQRKQSDSE